MKYEILDGLYKKDSYKTSTLVDVVEERYVIYKSYRPRGNYLSGKLQTTITIKLINISAHATVMDPTWCSNIYIVASYLF